MGLSSGAAGSLGSLSPPLLAFLPSLSVLFSGRGPRGAARWPAQSCRPGICQPSKRLWENRVPFPGVPGNVRCHEPSLAHAPGHFNQRRWRAHQHGLACSQERRSAPPAWSTGPGQLPREKRGPAAGGGDARPAYPEGTRTLSSSPLTNNS